jgi:hypothetical protein
MKKLKVDVEDIAMMMENQDRLGSQYYLDTETGETVVIPEELMTALEEGESCEGLPAWELELVPMTKEIFEGSERYEEIPTRPSHEGYNLMTQFALCKHPLPCQLFRLSLLPYLILIARPYGPRRMFHSTRPYRIQMKIPGQLLTVSFLSTTILLNRP